MSPPFLLKYFAAIPDDLSILKVFFISATQITNSLLNLIKSKNRFSDFVFQFNIFELLL